MDSGYGSQTTKVQRYGSHQEGVLIWKPELDFVQFGKGIGDEALLE